MSNQPFQDFNFSFALAQKAKAELQNDHEKLLERITNIVDSEKFHINGFPVLKNIINLQPQKNDLKKIAKALDRLGDLLESFAELDKKISVIDTVQADPHWFAWAFGDFSKEIDNDLENFFDNNNQ